jgi:DNA-binding transcriptional ArsR family regulator
MAHYSDVDTLFAALADPTRRSVISQLGRGPASVGTLAESAPMTLPSFMKHVRILEASGLIQTTKTGRIRTCTLDRMRLATVDDWLDQQRAIWDARSDRLEQFIAGGQGPS